MFFISENLQPTRSKWNNHVSFSLVTAEKNTENFAGHKDMMAN